MMFLFSGIRAEVEPVPGKKGWFQLTGKHIDRWTVDVPDTFADIESMPGTEGKVDYRAKILGIHSRDPEIEFDDPRFNHENSPDHPGGASFGVYQEGGKTWMLLAVNQAEYAIFRFLVPHEAGSGFDETDDPMTNYRIEPKAKPAKPTSKAAPAKKGIKPLPKALWKQAAEVAEASRKVAAAKKATPKKKAKATA